jgi:secondary thiamine-phosphate synthase enzyme
MRVATSYLELSTTKEDEIIDITGRVEEALASSGLQEGIATVFVTGSTAALTTIEHEPGLAEDFPAMMGRLAPKGMKYEHHRKWHDANGHSHVKASLLGPSISVPFTAGRMALGEWQQIVLVEFDIRPRDRKIVVQLIGN